MSTQEQTITPQAEEVLARTIRALGGKEAIAAIKGLATEADCSGPNGSFRTWTTSLRPDKTYFRQLSDRGTTEIWSTAIKTWMGSPEEGYRELGPQVREFIRGHEFHLLVLDLESRFSNHAVKGRELVNDKGCIRISMQDESGHPASVCIGEADWLPVEMVLNPSGATAPIRIIFDDWAMVNGIRYFQTFTLIESRDRIFQYRYASISSNTVPEDFFLIPDELVAD